MKTESFQVINPHAAGIDVGSRFHMVAIDQSPHHVRQFGVYTSDHQKLIEHLHLFGVTTIAMESTGSYWQTLFNALQSAGFEVLLAKSTRTKNVKGKKTDVLDCMWIQKLHSLGLLSGSFLLSDHLQKLRTFFSHRQHLIEQISKYINKMQKALRLMNIRLDVLLNDVTSKSGMAVIKAILSGERDPEKLASFVNRMVKKSREEIIVSLHGHWREDYLFELKSCLSFHNLYKQALLECDEQIEKMLLTHAPQRETSNEIEPCKITKRPVKHSPSFNVQRIAFT